MLCRCSSIFEERKKQNFTSSIPTHFPEFFSTTFCILKFGGVFPRTIILYFSKPHVVQSIYIFSIGGDVFSIHMLEKTNTYTL